MSKRNRRGSAAKPKRGPGRPFDDKRWAPRADEGITSDPASTYNKPPGLYAEEADLGEVTTPLTMTVRSGALHSRSEGWVPMVTLAFELVSPEDGSDRGRVNIALEQGVCMTLIEHLQVGLDRSREDARVNFGDIQFIPKRDD